MDNKRVAKEIIALAKQILAVKTSDMSKVIENAVDAARNNAMATLRQKQIPSYLRSVAGANWIMETNGSPKKPTITVKSVTPRGSDLIFAFGEIEWNRIRVVVTFKLGPIRFSEVDEKVSVNIDIDGKRIASWEQYGISPHDVGKHIADVIYKEMGLGKMAPADQMTDL